MALQHGDISLTACYDSDLPVINDMMREEGWTNSVDDLRLIVSVFGADSVLVARKDSTVLGCIAGYKQDDNAAYIGMFIMDKRYRNQGIGSILFTSLEKLLKSYTIVLDAAPKAIPFYERMGYIKEGTNIFLGSFNCAEIFQKKFNWSSSDDIIAVNEDIMNKLLAFDATLHPCGKRPFIQELLMHKNTIAFCTKPKKEDGEVDGFIVYNTTTHRLGLYSSDNAVAKSLLRNLLHEMRHRGINDVVKFEIPSHSLEKVVSVLDDLGISITPELDSVRMSIRGTVPVKWDKVFCILNTRCVLL